MFRFPQYPGPRRILSTPLAHETSATASQRRSDGGPCTAPRTRVNPSVATFPSADDTTAAPPPSEGAESPSPSDDRSPGAEESSPPGENGGSESGGSGYSGDSIDDPEPPPGPVTSYLSDLDPVGGLGNYKHTGTATVQRTTYGNSVIFSLNSFNGGAKTVTYNIPAGEKEFRATVGLDEKTESGCTVFSQVSFDGNPVNSGFTLPVGRTRDVVEKVGDAGRLTVTVNGVESPSGKVNGTCRAVWGTPGSADGCCPFPRPYEGPVPWAMPASASRGKRDPQPRPVPRLVVRPGPYTERRSGV